MDTTSATGDHDRTPGVTPAGAEGGPISHVISRVARRQKMIAGQLLRGVGLYPGQELVMMQLWQGGPQRQTDLIRVLDSDAATITRTIRRLEHAGFVRRVPARDDKRAHLIEPTPASLALRGQVQQIWTQLENLTVGSLDADTREDILRNLELLEENLINAALDTPE